MIGRLLTIDTGYQTVSAVQDLLEVKLAAGQAGFLLRAKVIQYSDAAAAEAEELPVNVKKAGGSFTSGSGGGTATVVGGTPIAASDGLTTKERNNTTQAVVGSGTLDVLERGVFNVLAGEWEFTATPELAHAIGPSEAVILSLDVAPADALTLAATIQILLTHG